MATTRSGAVREAALKLPLKERARLAHELIVSLDGKETQDPNWEAAWLIEIERRTAEVRDGSVELEDPAIVLKELRAELALGRLKRVAANRGTKKKARRRAK